MLEAAGSADVSGLSKRSLAPHGSEPERDPGPRLSGATVLVVDDNLALAENLAEILALGGFRTMLADCAETAHLRVGEGGIAAVISDVRLPGRSGIDLVDAIRKDHADVKVILMSAFSDAEAVAGAHRAGAEILSKPVEIKRLLALLESSN
jgi:DNA-binding NtrC family response regulator